MRHSLTQALTIVDADDTWEHVWMPLHKALWTEYKAAAPEAVASAFAVVKLAKGDFQKAIIYGANFGRDADTIAAIAGAISGAMNGVSKIPEAWIHKVRITAGICLPFTKGMDLFDVASSLAQLIR
jgi:ADP-ribosylglycohydrolase